MQIWQWVLIGIGIYLAALVLTYLALRYIYHKRMPRIYMYILNSMANPLFLPLGEICRPPWWRRKWLVRSGVEKGRVYLEEGFGLGISPVLASQMVGKRGRVYALDIQPLFVVLLWVIAKVGWLRNLNLIFSDASDTGLPDGSVDIVFINDAFHEFGDKEGTLKELYRVLKPDGLLSVKEDSKRKTMNVVELIGAGDLFSLVDRDKTFCKFKKNA